MTNEKPKLSSLSIFFPFMNDAGTVQRQLDDAYTIGKTLTGDLQVIALHGGASKDNTFDEIKRMQSVYPDLIIVDKSDNWERYAVIKYGFNACTKAWIFYTDGDAQYHLGDLPKMVDKQRDTGVDVVNGYKKERGDGFLRMFLGNAYAHFSSFIFDLPIRDTDCDFRLIRKSIMDKITLESHDSSILAEMLKKLQLVGATFVELPVNHYDRDYGKSNYTVFGLFKEKLLGDIKLYRKLRKFKGGTSSLRIIKFGGVGITSVVLQALLFNLLLLATRLSPTVATVLSDQFAILTSFILNNYFTFYDKKHTRPSRVFAALAKFWSIVMVATLVQAFIVFVGTSVFGPGVISANIFFAFGLIITFFWNYKVQKKFVW
jgi:putative flippase GtrA